MVSRSSRCAIVVDTKAQEQQLETVSQTIQPYLTPDGKLSCQNACRMASERNLTLTQISRIAQSEEIRISDCLLGQFGSLEAGEFDENIWQRLVERAGSEERIACSEAMSITEEVGYDAVRGTLLAGRMEVVHCALGCFRERRKTKLYLKTKNWIENCDEELVLSKGKIDILERIDELGSISRAAKVMGMSYKKAWNHIKILQQNLDDEILITQKGAGRDSGTRLTPIAREFIANYRQMQQRIETYADAQFKQLFLTARSRKR
jgi:molybdate transport repressor ModE-like protein